MTEQGRSESGSAVANAPPAILPLATAFGSYYKKKHLQLSPSFELERLRIEGSVQFCYFALIPSYRMI